MCYLGITLSTLEEVLERAHAQRQAVSRATSGMSTIHLASQSEASEDIDPADERMLEGDELLHASRDLIEWLLTLGHRLAGEAEETAAVDRLRAAFHSRLAGRAAGVRMSDVLIVFALLVGALDPELVHERVNRSIADGAAALLSYEGISLGAKLAQLANSMPSALRRGRAAHRDGRTQRTPPL